ncbi:MAG: beta-ketoacyl-[acyl-carrier-protein] synthase family protein [Verrucomicrobiaceae bacterium]|nr:beta-ketoacyl-[acyl-carrier-protein] synthase family protein [Verrucomicrobiaceae bacterium]
MTGKRRAVITGMGIVSPLGIGLDAHWKGLMLGLSPARRLTLFDTSHTAAKHAAWIEDWDAATWLPPHKLKRMERYCQFAVVAARLALENAGLTFNEPQQRVGVSIGTAVGGFGVGEQQLSRFLTSGPDAVSPSLGVMGYPATAQGHICMEFGLQGPSYTNTNSCAAGNSAIGDALRTIQRGEADVMLAGAAEAPISPLIFKAFDNLGAMSSYDGNEPQLAYRPLHKERNGFVMGEGSAILVIEELSHALARGATVLAEITGYAITNEAWHMASPEPSGEAMLRAMRLALSDAGIQPADIDYVSPHASGTPANDINELTQIRRLLGPRASKVPISGTKPFTGHTLGAAGSVEAVNCVLAMQNNWVPPTLALDDPDPAALDSDLVPLKGRHHEIRHILSLALGFGGIDTALVISRPADLGQ